MEIAMTKLSSKGQIVIPLEMRKNIKEGEKLIIIQTNDQLILKKADSLGKQFQEDLEFAKRTDEALLRYEKGEFKKMDFDEFIKKAKTW